MNDGTSQPVRARVVLAEDHPASAGLLRDLLQAEFDVVDLVADGRALIHAVTLLSPDVVVTDIGMPGLDGLEAAREILRRNPLARVVFVTVEHNPEMVQKCLDTGALGFVLKLKAGDELVTAVEAALSGRRYVSQLQR
jgi:DNA-binding NarL/FixJ family response regulator